MQSHKCAYLDAVGDRCRCDERCQYKLFPALPEQELVFCGKDQIVAILAAEPQETYFDGTEITIGGA